MSFGWDGATLLVGGGVNKKGEGYLFDASGEKPVGPASRAGRAPLGSRHLLIPFVRYSPMPEEAT